MFHLWMKGLNFHNLCLLRKLILPLQRITNLQMTNSPIYTLILLVGLYFLPSGAQAQNPAAYNHVSSWTNFAEFTLKTQGREITKEKGVTFVVEKEHVLTFQVLVLPDGKVKFVRPPRYNPEYQEFRLGGTDALYNFTFEPVADYVGEQWLTIEMHVKPDPLSRQAQ